MKSTDRILAKRYARAYDELNKDTASITQACEALRTAAQSLQHAQTYMRDPAVSSTAKTALVHSAFKDQPQIEKFLRALLQAKRYYLLDACVDEVQHLADKRLGVVQVEVETAFELSADQKKEVEKTLSKFSGRQARARFDVKPELLGGLRVRIEDKLIDGSLQGKFKKLEEELTK